MNKLQKTNCVKKCLFGEYLSKVRKKQPSCCSVTQEMNEMLRLSEMVVNAIIPQPLTYREPKEINPQILFFVIWFGVSTCMFIVWRFFSLIPPLLKSFYGFFQQIGVIGFFCAKIVMLCAETAVGLIKVLLLTVILFPVGIYLRWHLAIHWVLFVSYLIWTPYFLNNNSVSEYDFLGSLQTGFLKFAYPLLKLLSNEDRAFVLKIWADVLSQTLKGKPLQDFSFVVSNIELFSYSAQDLDTLRKNINHCMADFKSLAPLYYGMCVGK